MLKRIEATENQENLAARFVWWQQINAWNTA